MKNASGCRRFLFVSALGRIGDVAWRMLKEGYEVRLFIEEATSRSNLAGLVPCLESWRDGLEWADVVVFDGIRSFGPEAERLRAGGTLVIGGTKYTDRLEDDRSFGQAELLRHGCPRTPSYDFTSFDHGISFIRDNPGCYVVKPCGPAQEYKMLTYIGQDPSGLDAAAMLELYREHWSHEMTSFQLQPRVRGVEVAVGSFFNGQSFLRPININFEHKRLFPGEIGPMTAEMGTSMCWTEESRLFDLTIGRFTAELRRQRYVGYFDVNCIANDQGLFPLEFTARFGHPTISVQSSALASPLGEFFARLAGGEEFRIPLKSRYQVGVRIRIPPFPYDDIKLATEFSCRIPVRFTTEAPEGIHPEEVLCRDGVWYPAGLDGRPLLVTGSGATMEEACLEAYRRIDQVVLPNMFYRNDIGARWASDRERLAAWGYL